MLIYQPSNNTKGVIQEDIYKNFIALLFETIFFAIILYLIDVPCDMASKQLAEIIQNFKSLRGEIASFVTLRGPKDFTLQGCETRYNKLYGDTMVFLATYLPESVSDSPDGFVEIVYRKTAELLRKGNTFDAITVWVARKLIPYLAQLEKLGMQMDACIATLEFYRQKYFD